MESDVRVPKDVKIAIMVDPDSTKNEKTVILKNIASNE